MLEIVAYPAIFDYADDGVSVEFPDLPGCLTCDKTPAEAVYMARDALSLRLWSDECDNIPFPQPSDIFALRDTLEPNQSVQLVDVDMQEVRQKFSRKSINKMVTIPEWLDLKAKNAGVNFSQLLQKALIRELGIKQSRRK